jgi:hypothetical protein
VLFVSMFENGSLAAAAVKASPIRNSFPREFEAPSSEADIGNGVIVGKYTNGRRSRPIRPTIRR